MAVVVARVHDGDDFVAGLIDVALRRNAESERAVSGDYEIDAGNFAVGVIGNARFDAETQITVAIVRLRGNVNGKFAVSVKLARLLGGFAAIVIVVIVVL